jgi:GNAT superfamily N-acetyltransferase
LVVGYVIAEMQARLPIYPAGRYGFISDICVTERYRRRGIGRALAERAVRWCSGEGATSVELFAAERNPVSGAFWSAMGFGPYLRMLRMDVDDALRRGRP